MIGIELTYALKKRRIMQIFPKLGPICNNFILNLSSL